MYKEHQGMYAQQREKQKQTQVFDIKEAFECFAFLVTIAIILYATAILTTIQNASI